MKPQPHKNREKRVNWRQISRAISRAYEEASSLDSWNMEAIYQTILKDKLYEILILGIPQPKPPEK